jgi:hypothetical protein
MNSKQYLKINATRKAYTLRLDRAGIYIIRYDMYHRRLSSLLAFSDQQDQKQVQMQSMPINHEAKIVHAERVGFITENPSRSHSRYAPQKIAHMFYYIL